MWQRLLLLDLGLVLVAIVPLAHASPPDPTWMPGLYDDDDFDNVVIAVTHQQAVLDAAPLPSRPLRLIVSFAAPSAPGAPDVPAPATALPRAPPAPSS